MSITPYAVGGAALVIGLAVGYVKYMERDVTADKAEAKTAIVRAECSTNIADDVTQSALQQVATLTRQVNEWKAAWSIAEKKSRERLKAFNELNRKIGNVKDNSPIPDALELKLDDVRVRSAVPRDAGKDSADKAANGGEAAPAGDGVSPGTDPAPEAPGA